MPFVRLSQRSDYRMATHKQLLHSLDIVGRILCSLLSRRTTPDSAEKDTRCWLGLFPGRNGTFAEKRKR